MKTRYEEGMKEMVFSLEYKTMAGTGHHFFMLPSVLLTIFNLVMPNSLLSCVTHAA
jgi:hypothetical protein